jgi:dTDP-glucose pyrophosphorylase
MLNILIPLAGSTVFFEGDDWQFPKPLIEINSVPMIQLLIENLNQIDLDKNFIFLLKDEDCTKFHLSEIIRLLTNNKCTIIKIKGETKGALCSALLAIDHINNDDPLLISNGDQLFQNNLNQSISILFDQSVDGGCVVFESVHPRWSFVKVSNEMNIVEASEKRPISKNAIAGLYAFRRGQDFVEAAKEVIRKDSNINGTFYISSVINELILKDLKLTISRVDNKDYFTFYSPHKITEYERFVQN